jgi:nucleoside-diphosphate-sugar epimerase
VHAGHNLSLTSRSGAEVVPDVATLAADLLQPSVAHQLCQGMDVVFHLAGIAHQHATANDYQRLNVDASLTLAEAAIASGVSTFIYASSSRAAFSHGEIPDPYSRSKRAAEAALTAIAAGTNLRLVIVRPSLVYGANVRGNLALIARAVRANLPTPPERGLRSMISVQDLCRLLVQVAEDDSSSLPVLTVSDGERYSTRRIVVALRAAAGRSVPGYTLPLWCWRSAASLLDLLRRAPAGTHFSKLFDDDLCDSNAADAVHGWAPRQVFEDVANDIMRSPAGPGPAI